MDINYSPLLFLALVAGYVFVREWYGTRYKVVREDGHKLYFRSAYWGLSVTLVLLAFIIFSMWAFEKAFIFVSSNCLQLPKLPFPTFNQKVLLTLLISPFFAFFMAKIANYFTDNETCFYNAIKSNEFEQILVEAIFKEAMIMVTMDDNKVYVGFVYESYEPNDRRERQYFNMLPIMSGYREEKGRVNFTTFYDDIYALTDGELDHLEIDNFRLVLPIVKTRSVRFFDVEAYSKFQGNSDENSVGSNGD